MRTRTSYRSSCENKGRGRTSSNMMDSLQNGTMRLRKVATDTFLVRSDDRCKHCRRMPFCSTHLSFSLLHRDDMEEPMWMNPYVCTGYRPTEMPAILRFKSMFKLNNETVNIWSHLIGLVYFTWGQMYDNAIRLPKLGATFEDHVIFTGSAFCFQICMLMSALYHVFGCRNEDGRQWWLTWDVLGIMAGLMGTYLSGIYTAFFCHPTWLNIYLCVFCAMALTVFVAPMHKDYMQPKLCNNMAYYHLVCGAVVLYGIFPTVHWIHLNGGFASVHVINFLPNVLVVYILFGIAFTFYVSMMPERFRPGCFDIVGWSHQWWHLLILAAMVWWRNAGFVYLDFNRNSPMACHS